jgi:hypothetical protein
MNSLLATLFAGALLVGAAAAPTAAPGPVVVPLYAAMGAARDPRLGIDVTIGTSTQRLLFDTGSAGLRVNAKALPPDAYRRTGRSLKADFGFGDELRGEEVAATLAIGAAHASNVPIHVVDEIGCSPEVRDCPDNAGEPVLFSGIYPGIFGAYLRQTGNAGCCASPLIALDGGVGRRFIVHANFNAPTLTLNPDDVALTAFSVVDFAAFGAPRGCIRVYGGGQETCGPVIFDTGTPQLLITTTGMIPAPPWTHATLRIGSWTHDFAIGAYASGGVPFSVRRTDVIRIVVGLTAMQDFDVFYDLEHRRVGIVNAK